MTRNLFAGLVALVIATGLLAAPAAAQTTTQITIKAKGLWRNTGVVLSAGDVVTINAAGQWEWSDGMPKHGPDGDPTDDYNAFDLFSPFDFFSQGRLIAYIGDFPKQGHYGDTAFFPQSSGYISIGSGQTFRAPYGGKLWLGFNDGAVTKSTADNSGFVVANVTVGNADTNGPNIALTAPTGVYALSQSVTVHYSCSDAETTVASCTGPVADGASLDTSHIGHFAFTVVAKDANGNTSSATMPYVIVDTSSAAVWPTGGTFEPTFVGNKSSFHQFYLTNPQPSAMDISDISVSGSFVKQATTCGASLAARKTCRVTVLFQPTNRGTNFGQLDVTGSLTVQSVPLWGIGALIHAAPNLLSFGAQDVGTTSAPMHVTLTNNRTQGETVHEIVASGDFAVDPSSTCPIHGGKLARGKSCDIAVTFSPTTGGGREGALYIHSQTPVDPLAVMLNGNETK